MAARHQTAVEAIRNNVSTLCDLVGIEDAAHLMDPRHQDRQVTMLFKIEGIRAALDLVLAAMPPTKSPEMAQNGPERRFRLEEVLQAPGLSKTSREALKRALGVVGE